MPQFLMCAPPMKNPGYRTECLNVLAMFLPSSTGHKVHALHVAQHFQSTNKFSKKTFTPLAGCSYNTIQNISGAPSGAFQQPVKVPMK